MEAKPYPEEKRGNLIKKDKEDFIAFLKEVTDGEGIQFIQQKLLPSQGGGFRAGNARTRHIQLQLAVPTLIHNLKKEQELTNSDSFIWSKFKDAWKAWVISHHELNQILLESFDNSSDFDENHKCIVPPNSELDIQCFKTLLEASRNNQIDQETIQRFYEYGYFLPSDEIEALIEKALPRAEIERQQRLAALPDQVERLSESIKRLDARISEIESTDETTQKFNRQIAEVTKSFDSQLSQIKSNLNKRISRLINSRLSKLEESVTSLETQLLEAEFINDMDQKITQLDQRVQKHVESHVESTEARLDRINKAIVEIKTMQREQNRTTSAPRIAHQSVQIGENYAVKLAEDREPYQDENDYLSDFVFSLGRFGITDSNDDETGAAIHLAMKAFSALEIVDTRIIDVWRLMCANHLHVTKIDVEMGWLGLQDWFPKLFSQECFGEQLRKMDLDISVKKMLERGDMLWAIHLNNCDRSFPESYLPRFLDWITELSGGAVRVFLTRSSGINHCQMNQDVYVRVARLTKPQGPEPIEARNLIPSDLVVTQSEWESWCQPAANVNLQHDNQLTFLNQLRTKIGNMDSQIPTVVLREVQHYLRLSHGILAASKALDWALTFRLLPWIGNHRELIEIVQNLIHQGNSELPHFQEGLVQANEENE